MAPTSLRVLVVDDTPAQRLLTAELLRSLGHSVDMAVNGAEAVRAVSVTDYDLVLMDYEMPVMDGIAATRKIKALRDRALLPVVMVSGRSDAHVRAAAADAGIAHYVQRPLGVSTLKHMLSRYTDASATAAL